MKVRNLFLFLFLFLPILAFSGIAGRYNSVITSSDGSKERASVLITKVGPSLYQAVWTYADRSVDTGTGVKKGTHISFVYNFGDQYGVVQYKIVGGDKLLGPWVDFGSTEKGFEKIWKIH